MVYLRGFQMCLAVQTLFKKHKRRTLLCKCKETLVKEGGVCPYPLPMLPWNLRGTPGHPLKPVSMV